MNKKHKFSRKVGILSAAVLAVLFLLEPVIGYAQYSQVNSYGNIYTYVNSYDQLNITTTNATNITGSSVILNGLVNGNNLYNTYNLSTWFEYGTNTNLGYFTPHGVSNSGYANYSSNIAGLNPNTIYYFRAVAQNPQGVIYGSINSFRTNFPNIGNAGDNINSSVPTAITDPASFISNSSVQLNSLIYNGVNGSSNTWFE